MQSPQEPPGLPPVDHRQLLWHLVWFPHHMDEGWSALQLRL